jgi:hypothetical protein
MELIKSGKFKPEWAELMQMADKSKDKDQASEHSQKSHHSE